MTFHDNRVSLVCLHCGRRISQTNMRRHVETQHPVDWQRVTEIRRRAGVGQGVVLSEVEAALCRQAYQEDPARYAAIGETVKRQALGLEGR